MHLNFHDTCRTPSIDAAFISNFVAPDFALAHLHAAASSGGQDIKIPRTFYSLQVKWLDCTCYPID